MYNAPNIRFARGDLWLKIMPREHTLNLTFPVCEPVIPAKHVGVVEGYGKNAQQHFFE